MSRDDDQPSVPLSAGVAQRERMLLGQLYRGNVTKACPDCGALGMLPLPPSFPGGRPQKRICPTCRGQKAVPA